MKPYRVLLIVSVGLLVISILMMLVVPRLLQYIIDEGITPGEMSVILQGSLVMLVAALIGAAATVFQAIFMARVSEGMAYDIRNELIDRIQTLSFGNLDILQTGQLMTRVSSDVDVVKMFSNMGLMMIIRAVMMMIGSLGFLIVTDWKLSLIMIVLIPLLVVIFLSFARRAGPLFMIVQQKLADLNTVVQESLAGVQVVKAFVREEYEIERFEDRNTSYMLQYIKVGRMMAVAFPIIMLLANLATLAVIGFGGMRVIGELLSVGELVAFNNYMMTTMFPMLMLGMVLTMLTSADASAKRVMDVLESEALVTDAPSARELTAMRGQVSFENVSFHYATEECCEEVLRNVSFTVEAGQRVALLGATGSGKSTLVNLIPRFYDVTEGRVLIDGVDVRDVTQYSLRSQMGIVLQQITLFSGTVRDNIAYGAPNASLDDVIAAAKIAQAHDFIMRMPDGYDSKVESRGANLSGGQKQRIAIARALLVDPSILILDDSTSSVDMETEFQIQEALDALTTNRTTFIIAQRISSVLSADKIIVLERGEIAAQGSHQELLQISPIYREIYYSQLNGNRVGAEAAD
jgi:ATP-binding cassette subfamily B protein